MTSGIWNHLLVSDYIIFKQRLLILLFQPYCCTIYISQTTFSSLYSSMTTQNGSVSSLIRQQNLLCFRFYKLGKVNKEHKENKIKVTENYKHTRETSNNWRWWLSIISIILSWKSVRIISISLNYYFSNLIKGSLFLFHSLKSYTEYSVINFRASPISWLTHWSESNRPIEPNKPHEVTYFSRIIEMRNISSYSYLQFRLWFYVSKLLPKICNYEMRM